MIRGNIAQRIAHSTDALENVEKVVVDESAIKGESKPYIVFEEEQKQVAAE
jgi:hypothetical protein